jgi:hypothetical protein
MGVQSASALAVNINDTVRIRMTVLGRRIARQEIDDLNATLNGVVTLRYPEEDSGGWSRWQLWEVMRTFGAVIGNGMPVPFETEFELWR